MKEQNAVTTTLRLTEEKSEYIKKKANEIGISQNAFTTVLIDMGIKVYESQITTIQKMEQHHYDFRKAQPP